MTSYFIRHTNDPEADLERGFSFEQYNLFDTERAAFEHMADFSGDAYDANLLKWHHVEDDETELDMDWYMDEYSEYIGQDNTTGKYGVRRSGLCAYNEYATSDEACAAVAVGDYATAAGGDFTQYVVVYAGERTFDKRDGCAGDITFAPTRIVWRAQR